MNLQAIERLENLPRVESGIRRTPIQYLANLSRELGIELYIKRDDLNGLAMGGNKLRKLDYFIADALQQGASTVLTFGSLQTNHGRLTAAAAAMWGLKSILIMDELPPAHLSGSLLLDHLLAADIYYLDETAWKNLPDAERIPLEKKLAQEAAEKITKDYESRGEKVYQIPEGGSSPLGAVAYIMAAKEIKEQEGELGVSFDYAVSVLGSTGTYAGLCLGSRLYGSGYRLIGVCVSPSSEYAMQRRLDFINQVSAYWSLDMSISRKEMEVETAASGIAYDVPDQETLQAICLLAQKEGILLDPCYTGKAFNGLLKMVKNGRIPLGSRVLFLHSGGLPGLFSEQHVKAMEELLYTADKKTVFSSSPS